jgi:hypothetical protein
MLWWARPILRTLLFMGRNTWCLLSPKKNHHSSSGRTQLQPRSATPPGVLHGDQGPTASISTVAECSRPLWSLSIAPPGCPPSSLSTMPLAHRGLLQLIGCLFSTGAATTHAGPTTAFSTVVATARASTSQERHHLALRRSISRVAEGETGEARACAYATST